MCFRERILLSNEPFKLEILDSIKTEPITMYSMVSRDESKPEPLWWDLCAGPHLESTGQVDPRAVELLSIAGAYWRGDEKLPVLQVRTLRPTEHNYCDDIVLVRCTVLHYGGMLVLIFMAGVPS